MLVDTSVPKFLNGLPITNLAGSHGINEIVVIFIPEGIITNVVIQLVILESTDLNVTLVDMVSNDGGNNMGGLKIGCITHFGVACSVVNDNSVVFHWELKELRRFW